MRNIKEIFTNIRVIILIIFLVLMVFAIYPNPFNKGVVIKSVIPNSAASLAGIENSKVTAPMSLEKILMINNIPVTSIEDYYKLTSNALVNQSIFIKTNKKNYQLLVKPKIKEIVLNETEQKIVEEFILVNETINNTVVQSNKSINKTIDVPKIVKEIIGVEEVGLRVDNAPLTNLRKGLDLQGGTRVLLKPVQEINDSSYSDIVDNIKERLNVYGLADITVKEVSTSTLLGEKAEKLIMLEIAGATEEEVKDLIGKQGKFEANIGNQTVFIGGRNDITSVCTTATCSGIDPDRPCSRGEEGFVCGFRFAITLSPSAAQRQADITDKLDVVTSGSQKYLSQELTLYLDDTEVDSLKISSDLKGKAVTDIAVSGSGTGNSQKDAIDQTLKNMKKLQTVMKTGSFPVKLEIAKIDNISPTLGKEFINNSLFIGLIAALVVVLTLVISYRNLKIAIPIMINTLSETLIILGIASIIGWNLDLASIAGIIASIGTGVDDLIVITDEMLKKQTEVFINWKERIKRAFFIVLSAFFATAVAMIPLWSFGGGMLKGFAVTTLLGITAGVLITRPAFAHIMQKIIEE